MKYSNIKLEFKKKDLQENKIIAPYWTKVWKTTETLKYLITIEGLTENRLLGLRFSIKKNLRFFDIKIKSFSLEDTCLSPCSG